ncbi:MAG: HXXEE domain-containing protein [Pseudomonadota bacterium]
MDRHLSLLLLVLAFAMLWVPIGQHRFLVDNWMKVGTFMAPFLLFVAVASKPLNAERGDFDLRIACLLLLVAYIVHQFEEHWIDLFGNVYAFQGSVNDLLLGLLGAPQGSIGPLTKEGVFIINTSLVWLVAGLGVWSAPRHIFPALAMMGIVLVNAIAHILNGVAGYNPGLLTSVIVFLPLSGFQYFKSLRSGTATLKEVIDSLIWAVLAHVLMVVGLIAANWFNLFPESLYFALLISWSIVPVFLFRKSHRTQIG